MSTRGTARANGNLPQTKICQFKLVLLGDMAVGKSSLVLRFVKGQFDEFQETTIGGEKERFTFFSFIQDIGVLSNRNFAQQYRNGYKKGYSEFLYSFIYLQSLLGTPSFVYFKMHLRKTVNAFTCTTTVL